MTLLPIGSFERLSFLAVATPLVQIGEYHGMKKPVLAEAEQAFWAACEFTAPAGLAQVSVFEKSHDLPIHGGASPSFGRFFAAEVRFRGYPIITLMASTAR